MAYQFKLSDRGAPWSGPGSPIGEWECPNVTRLRSGYFRASPLPKVDKEWLNGLAGISDMTAIFSPFDVDGSKVFDINDFCDGIWKMATSTETEREKVAREKLRRIFKSLDGDNSGRPSPKKSRLIEQSLMASPVSLSLRLRSLSSE